MTTLETETDSPLHQEATNESVKSSLDYMVFKDIYTSASR